MAKSKGKETKAAETSVVSYKGFDKNLHGAATASGNYGKAKGKAGCALFLVYRAPSSREIKHAWAGIAGRDGIEADVFYTLNSDGKPMKA